MHEARARRAALAREDLPFFSKPVSTEPGYLDLESHRYVESHGMSDAHHATSITVRVRASDHAIACASSTYQVSGTGEYGGFSGSSYESIAVDYGDGTPRCRSTR